jgi:hypothetical protein
MPQQNPLKYKNRSSVLCSNSWRISTKPAGGKHPLDQISTSFVMIHLALIPNCFQQQPSKVVEGNISVASWPHTCCWYLILRVHAVAWPNLGPFTEPVPSWGMPTWTHLKYSTATQIRTDLQQCYKRAYTYTYIHPHTSPSQSSQATPFFPWINPFLMKTSILLTWHRLGHCQAVSIIPLPKPSRGGAHTNTVHKYKTPVALATSSTAQQIHASLKISMPACRGWWSSIKEEVPSTYHFPQNKT